MEFWETYDECVSTMLDLKELDTQELRTDATDLDKLKYYVYQLKCHNTPSYDLSFIGNEQLRDALEQYFETNKSKIEKIFAYPSYILELGSKLREFYGLPSGRWDIILSDDIIEKDRLIIENKKLQEQVKRLESQVGVVNTSDGDIIDYAHRRILDGRF